MEMNDVQINEVMINVSMGGMELHGTSTEGYFNPSGADLEGICIAAISTL